MVGGLVALKINRVLIVSAHDFFWWTDSWGEGSIKFFAAQTTWSGFSRCWLSAFWLRLCWISV